MQVEKLGFKNDGFYKLYRLTLFVYFVNSMHPWFLLRITPVVITIIFFIFTLFVYFKGYFSLKNIRFTSIIFLQLMFLWIARDTNINGIIEALMNSVLICSLIYLRRDRMLDCIKFITKWLAIIIFISSIFYILFLLHVPLPHSSFALGGNSLKDSLENYYFFVQVYEGFGFTRFFSIFLEPGYLTLGVAPLLFLNKYDIINKYVLMLIFGQLLSFSLAGFILLLFGIFYVLLFSKVKRKLKKFSAIIITITIAFIAAYNFFGEAYFEHTVFRRIEFVNGTLSGDDRSSKYLDYKYDNLMSGEDMWVGTKFDVTQSEKGVSGYKLFTVENGLIGVLLVILTYLSIISFKVRFNLRTGEIIFCLLMLYQNAYPWASCILFSAVASNVMFSIRDTKNNLMMA